MSAPTEPIRSASNPLLKRVRAAAAGRAEDGVLLLEGDRLVDEAHRSGLELEVVLVDEDRGERRARLDAAGLPVRAVRSGLLDAAGSLEHSAGCLAIARAPAARGLEALDSVRLVAAVAGIQDPGNLGALARTAEAAGVGALVVLRGGCRPWSPKALRGSMGSLLRLPVLELESAPASVTALSTRGFRHVCARTRGGIPHRLFDWSGRVVLWFASETGGFPAPLSEASARFEGVSIPMHGAAESLNVAAAAAVLLFAAGGSGSS